ncbi:MAG: zf-HC2 domain-containing protein [Telluria sp.]
MNSHAARTEPATHEQAQQLLPWLPSATPCNTEFAAVRAHVDQCPHCQADLAWQDRLRAAMPPVGATVDADRAFAALLPRLGPQPVRVSVLEQWRRKAAANSNWLRWTAVAQLAVIAGLALMLARPAADPGDYRALGAAVPAEGNLVLMFRPDTTEGEVRRILQVSGARVIDGPTAAGAWVLAVPGRQAGPALARMRAEPAVTLAQPMAARSRP